jgi:hypothetical protein
MSGIAMGTLLERTAGFIGAIGAVATSVAQTHRLDAVRRDSTTARELVVHTEHTRAMSIIADRERLSGDHDINRRRWRCCCRGRWNNVRRISRFGRKTTHCRNIIVCKRKALDSAQCKQQHTNTAFRLVRSIAAVVTPIALFRLWHAMTSGALELTRQTSIPIAVLSA